MLSKFKLIRLRLTIAKMKRIQDQGRLRHEYEMAARRVKIEREYEDAKKRLKRADEDWKLELAFHSDLIRAHEDEYETLVRTQNLQLKGVVA